LYQENIQKDPGAGKKGIETYQKLLVIDSDNLEALYQIALLLHLEGDYRKSMEYLAQLPEEQAERSQALALRCANQAVLRQDSAAESCSEKLISSAGFIESDLVLLLPAFLSPGRSDLAIKLLENLHWRGLLSIPSVEGLAELYAENNRFRDARNLLESLAGRHPDLPALLMKLAWMCFSHSDYEGSLRYLAHARDLNPNDGRIHVLFGLACIELNLGMEAINSLEQAVALEPDNPSYNYALGYAILAWKEAKEAVPYFEKFHSLEPNNPKGTAALAQAHFLNKQYELSKSGFEESIHHSETELISNYYLGVIARIELRIEDAESYFRKVLELDPQHADTLAEMGWIYTRNREFEKAKEILDQALQIDPENYHANFNLMTLYSRTRDERFEQQKAKFEEIKEKRWQYLTNSLRSIEVVPHYVFPGRSGKDIFTDVQ
jgi:tetratricopeptide (TPR) repeat protein